MADMEGGGPLDPGTLILPILERITDPKINRQQIDTQVELNRTLLQLIKTFEGFNSTYKGGGGSGRFPTNRNPLQPQAPSSLMNAFSWMGEKKDKAMEVIKKGFFKLFKTDYFTNLLKSIGALAKAIGNTFMDWLKFFIMMAFIDPSGGFMRDIINLFTQIGMIVFKTVMPLIPIAVKMMFDTIVYVFKLILKLMPSIIDTIMRTFTQLGDTFPILKPIIGFINQFLSAIRSLFLILNDPKADKGGGFRNFLSKVFKILGELLGKVIDYAVKQLPIIIEFVTDFIANTLIPAFVKYAPIVLDEISKAIGNLTTKYPSLKVWIQPFKDILDMMSAFIGSFAKFNSTEYIQGLDEYKKKEKELFAQKQYQSANEQTQMKMLSDMQYGFMIDNKDMLKKANEDFNKLNEDKVKLAKDKWSELLDHVLDTLGVAYKSLPTEAKVGIWAYIIITVLSAIASVVLWFGKMKAALILFSGAMAKFGFYIGEFIAWIQLYGVAFLTKVGTIASSIWEGIVLIFETITGFFTGAGLAIGSLIVVAIVGIMYYFKDELLKWASETFGEDSAIFKIFDGLFAMIDYAVEWIKGKLFSWFGDKPKSKEEREKEKSKNISPQAKPYNPYADPMFQKQQKEMAIKYESDKNKAISKITNSPNNIYDKLRKEEQARVSAGYYNKLTQGATDSLKKSLESGVNFKAQIDVSTEKIKLPAPKMETPKYDWVSKFFLELRIGFDKLIVWLMAQLSNITLGATDRLLSSQFKLKSKVLQGLKDSEALDKFYSLDLTEQESSKFLEYSTKKGSAVTTADSELLVKVLTKLDASINKDTLAASSKSVQDLLFMALSSPTVVSSSSTTGSGKPVKSKGNK